MVFIRTLFLILIIAHAGAQDMTWLKPAKFRYNVGDTCRITLMTGERLIGTALSIPQDSAGTFSAAINEEVFDLTPRFVVNQQHHFALPLTKEGTWQLTWDRFKAFKLKTSAELESYLKENAIGGMPATTEKPFIIHEHTYDVLLIQSGKMRTSFTTPGKFPLEIIPDKNPFNLKGGDQLTLTIKNHGAPVFGFEVVVRNRYNDRTTIQKSFTEKDGTMRINISSPGPWVISYSTIDAYRNVGTLGITRVNLLFGY